MKKPALVVMGRAPVPGQVKTRLQASLSAEQCASLYQAFLLDIIDLAASLTSYQPFLAYFPAGAKRLFQDMAHSGMGIIAQSGADLGSRMNALITGLLAEGHPAVVIVGSDIPTLQPGILEDALRIVRNHDLCLGPAEDGGYYLIGARKGCEEVFQGIPWSTPDVFESTVKRAELAGLSVGMVDLFSDIDTADDLERLRGELKKLRNMPGARVPARTMDWLSNLSECPSDS